MPWELGRSTTSWTRGPEEQYSSSFGEAAAGSPLFGGTGDGSCSFGVGLL